MKTTIDKAGRVVIPAKIRQKAGLKAGAEVEIALDEQGAVRLKAKVSGPRLVRIGKRLVARPTVPKKDIPEVDWAALVEAERERWQ